MLLKRRAVRLALKELSKDAVDAHVIAQRLRDAGVRGGHHPRSCPVANYLYQKTGVGVSVGSNWVTNDWVSRAPVLVPGIVAAFIDMFDYGYYTDLDIVTEGGVSPYER